MPNEQTAPEITAEPEQATVEALGQRPTDIEQVLDLDDSQLEALNEHRIAGGSTTDRVFEGLKLKGAGADEQTLQDDHDQRVHEVNSRIAELESRIATAQPPRFKNANEEVAWHRNNRAVVAATRATEVRIAAQLAALSEAVGQTITRDDERIDTRTPESFETSLRAIEREEKAAAQASSKPKPRGDAHRYTAGTTGARTVYDPKKFEGTGDVFGALRAKSRAMGIPDR